MIPLKNLENLSFAIFKAMGCSNHDAQLAANVLLSADLRGVDSHGLARLSGYVRLWEAKRVNPNPNMKIIHQTPSTAVIDADAALGLVAAPFAMQVAMEKAEKVGTGWVAVQNSNHFGIAGYHAMLALEKDMIGWAMTNASPLVSPTFSKSRLLGTNPISVAVPTQEEPPYVADFATTTAANGKLEVLKRLHKQAPLGWVQDAEGHITQDVDALKKGGAMLPLGGDREHGSHKGYILGSLVDILSGVLSGANFGPWVPPFVSFLPLAEQAVGKGLGHFLGAMRIDAFQDASEFKQRMDHWIKTFRNAETIDGEQEVLIPGDPERRLEAERRVNGIYLLPAVIDDLTETAQSLGIDAKEYFKG